MRMPMHSIHLGEFVAGKFTLPQTPVVTNGSSGLSEFVAGKFAVPQNPILDAQTGMSGCGCGGGCGGCGGMGDLSTDLTNTWTALQGQTILSMPAGYVVGGLFIAAIALPIWMSQRKR